MGPGLKRRFSPFSLCLFLPFLPLLLLVLLSLSGCCWFYWILFHFISELYLGFSYPVSFCGRIQRLPPAVRPLLPPSVASRTRRRFLWPAMTVKRKGRGKKEADEFTACKWFGRRGPCRSRVAYKSSGKTRFMDAIFRCGHHLSDSIMSSLIGPRK